MLTDQIVHFARVLRAAGLPAGPDRVLAAIAAVEVVGVQRRDDVHAALAAVLLDRHEQQEIFDAAFDAFWRGPERPDPLLHALLPKVRGRGVADRPPPRRLAEALAAERALEERRAAPEFLDLHGGRAGQRPGPGGARIPAPAAGAPADEEVSSGMGFSFSDRERLQRADFESMTAQEFELAQALAERAPLPVEPVRRRRREAAAAGARIDLRRTLQRLARQPQTIQPAFTQGRRELPPLVVLLDISGSMERYARLFLHYVHGLTRRHLRVQTFTFGTRLSNITRCLRHRDPDVALQRADEQVQDWKGGTRIATCLAEFNRRWARRALGGNAAVLLVTDGLDRDDCGSLGQAAAQLHRMAHEVVWLNPLLRFDGFEPRAAGVRAILPHVDRFLPVHNLASLADLGAALREPPMNPRALLR